MPNPSFLHTRTLVAFACAAQLAGCATPRGGREAGPAADAPPAAQAPVSAPAGPPGGPPAARKAARKADVASAPASNLPTHAAVTKDARRIEGMLTMWQKEDKVWIELRPEDFDQPFFFSPKVSQGLGEPGFYGGMMASRYADWGAPQIVQFRRIHNIVQLVALNDAFRGKAGTPAEAAVAAAYSPSLLGSAQVASQPDPEGKGVLVEANAFFLADLLGMAIHLQQSYRQGYGMDARNSFFESVRGTPDEVVFQVSAHYATGSIAAPAANASPGTPVPTVPSFVPDVRSLFFGLHYSLARLPGKPMEPRAADPRVGYFTTTVADFTDDTARTPRERFVSRWRLEKKDPAAALSEPVKPITYWLDKTIPLKYRDTIARGILEWNKAFERIGFKDAIVVRQQADDADFDTLDVGTASVRWVVDAASSFGAIGPHHVDPRTGEILDADIAIESLSSRNQRAHRAQVLAIGQAFDWPALLQSPAPGLSPEAAGAYGAPSGGRVGRPAAPRSADQACRIGDYAAEQMDYGLDVLEARGDIDPDSPEADAWVQAYLFDTTLHEVGHTLGLRHNFRASRAYTDQQVSDPAFTGTHALSGSVMDYVPVNLALGGRPGGAPFSTTIGPYDYWAIEYAYKVLPQGQTARERREALQAIAARGSERELEYGTDEDNLLGVDPEALVLDLGDDLVAFARKRFEIAAELFRRQEARTLRPGEDYSALRRSVTYALRDATRSAGILLRQLGGVATLRDFPGSGRDPMQPLAPGRQKLALDTLIDGVLGPDSFRVSPALQRRLAPDFLERGDASAGGDYVSTDYPVETVMLDFQRQLLSILMSDGMAQRLEDSAPKLDEPGAALMPADIYARLTRALWTDPANFGAGGKADIPARRRELQRDHVNRLANVLLHAPGGVRVDMRSTLRAEAVALSARIQAARRRPSLSEASRQHLADCIETLRAALAAPMARSGF